MYIKTLFKDIQLKRAALLLAEQQRKVKEKPGDDLLFAQVAGMIQMAHEIFNNYDLKLLCEHYSYKLDQELPKPGEKVLFYDPTNIHQPKLAKVTDSTEWPRWVRIEYEDDRTFELTDRDIYLLLYW